MPRLLREIIVSSLSQHADLDVFEIDLAAAGSSAPPLGEAIDVLMLGSEGAALDGEHERLLRSHPWLRILAIDRDGRHAALYDLRTHRIALTEISTAALVEAIRNACSEPGAAGLLETTQGS